MRILIGYLFIVNVVTFLTYGMDKRKARKGSWRIPERTLLFLAMIGGSIGALAGMRFFHHKTQKRRFAVGIPVILIFQIIIIYIFYNNVLTNNIILHII